MPETSNAELAQSIIDAREEMNRRLKAMLPEFEQLTQELGDAVRPIAEKMADLLKPFEPIATGSEDFNAMRTASNQATETVSTAQLLVERFQNRQKAAGSPMPLPLARPEAP